MKTLTQRKRLLTAFILMLVCIIPAVLSFFTLPTAKAESDIDDENNVALTNFYYFSDYEHCENYYNALCQYGGFIEHELYRLPTESPYTSLAYFFADGDGISNIRNAYVIVEIRGGMRRFADLPLSVCCDLMYDFFAGLKGNNCKIMFINGTDESVFRSGAAFLRFADIHVNTDNFTTFMKNIIITAYNDCGQNPIQNCTFLLDKNFFVDSEGYNCRADGIFLHYFIPVLKKLYIDDLLGSGRTIREFLKNKGEYHYLPVVNIKIIIHLYDDVYYDFASDNNFSCYDLDDLYFSYLYNQRIYTIGTTWSGIEYAEQWNENVNYLKEYYESLEYSDCIKNYLYCQDVPFSQLDFPNVFACNSTVGNIFNIMQDFILDVDLKKYNNYYGVCKVSHKDIAMGEGGWMIVDPSEYDELFDIDNIEFEELENNDLEIYNYKNAGADDSL